MSVQRDTSADAAEQAHRIAEPSIGFWFRVRREQCPFPPGSDEAQRWLTTWDRQLDQALQDLYANRRIVMHAQAIRKAFEDAGDCLLACEKTVKAANLRMRCRASRAALTGLQRTITESIDG